MVATMAHGAVQLGVRGAALPQWIRVGVRVRVRVRMRVRVTSR